MISFHFLQYFNEFIVAAGKGSSAMEFAKFKEAHHRIRDIYKYSPNLLLHVIPQLEEELKV